MCPSATVTDQGFEDGAGIGVEHAVARGTSGRTRVLPVPGYSTRAASVGAPLQLLDVLPPPIQMLERSPVGTRWAPAMGIHESEGLQALSWKAVISIPMH